MSKILITQGKHDPIIISTSDRSAFSILQAMLVWRENDTKNIFPKLVSEYLSSDEDSEYPTKLSFVEIPELTILTTDQGALSILQLLLVWRFEDDDEPTPAHAEAPPSVEEKASELNLQDVKTIFKTNPDGSINETEEEKKVRIDEAVRRISVYQRTGVDPGPRTVDEEGVGESKNDL